MGFLPGAQRDFGAYLWELILIRAVEVVLLDVTLAEHRQGLSQGLRGHHTLQFGLLQVLLLLPDNIGHLLLQRGVVRMLLGKNTHRTLRTNILKYSKSRRKLQYFKTGLLVCQRLCRCFRHIIQNLLNTLNTNIFPLIVFPGIY